MKPHSNKTHKESFTFSYRAAETFKVLAGIFIIMNLMQFIFHTGKINWSIGSAGLLISSIALIILLFAEGYIPSGYKRLKFTVYVLISFSCGFILYSSNSYTSNGVFIASIVVSDLKLPAASAAVLSIIYSISYLLSMVFLSGGAKGTILSNLYMPVIFLSIMYLCHYVSGFENEKNKQDEMLMSLSEENYKLERSLEQKDGQLEKEYWDTIDTLISVIEERDYITGDHSIKVCEYAVKIAQKAGLSSQEVSVIMKAAILHDIGKVGIPDSVLLKPGHLTDEEYNMIMNHPEIGCKILSKIENMDNIIPLVLHHHERIDGMGYPDGLKDGEIPEGAKIIAVADSYDAMTSNRPYRKGMPKKEAKKRLLSGMGTQFEPKYVQLFMDILDSSNVDDIRNYRFMESTRKNYKMV